MYDAICAEVIANPLALMNEEYLETVASLALVRNGAALLQGSNRPGKFWRIAVVDGGLAVSIVPNIGNQVGLQFGRGRPLGAFSPDLRIDLGNELSPYSIEIKTRCGFSSSSANSSKTFMKDMAAVMDRKCDAFVLASDSRLYADLRNERVVRRGQPGDIGAKELFAEVLPPLEEVRRGCHVMRGAVWSSGRCYTTKWGERLVLVVSLGDPVWAQRVVGAGEMV